MGDYDVVVIGAGSAGLNTAINCAKLGLSAAVVEEHAKIGFPRHCSGLYSTRLLSMTGIEKEFYEHEVRGARFHPPSGKTIEVCRNSTVAFVINRELFDVHLSEIAKECGVDIMTGTKASEIRIEKGCAAAITKKESISAKLVCGADGSNSTVARQLGIKTPPRLHGIMAIAKEEDYSDFVDMYFDNKLYPGFFAWKIPRGKTVEYGIAGDVGPKNVDNFNRFLGKFGVTDYELSSGVIPIGFQKSFADRVLLVGDAAAQTKPLTGGGVIYGMICSRIAAQTFADAVKQNRFDEKFLSRYQTAWRKRIGNGISRGLFIRALYAKLPNRAIDILFSAMNNPMAKRVLENYGDMDFILGKNPHSGVFSGLL